MSKENIDPIKEYKEQKYIVFKYIITIPLVIVAILLSVEIINRISGLGEAYYNSYIRFDGNIHNEETFDFSKQYEILYNNFPPIPTLYKCTHYAKTIDCTYKYEDERFGEKVTTIELTFDNIPKRHLTKYKKYLENNEYTYTSDWEGNQVFSKEFIGADLETGEDTEYTDFVIVGKTRIIYGILLGDYERIFK